MAIFRDKWFVIQRKKQSNSNDIYFVFSCLYWKVICAKKPSKNEKNIDIWSEISMEIEVKDNLSIHNIRNIKIKSGFNYENLPYKTLEQYLKIIAYIKQNFPEWMENKKVYEILEFINSENLNDTSLLLLKLKIVYCNWMLPYENSDKTVSKILKFISTENHKNIVKLTWINDEIKFLLENLV